MKSNTQQFYQIKFTFLHTIKVNFKLRCPKRLFVCLSFALCKMKNVKRSLLNNCAASFCFKYQMLYLFFQTNKINYNYQMPNQLINLPPFYLFQLHTSGSSCLFNSNFHRKQVRFRISLKRGLDPIFGISASKGRQGDADFGRRQRREWPATIVSEPS